MRIGFVVNHEIVNADYRAYQAMNELRRRGHDVVYRRPDGPLLQLGELKRCDVVLVHRFTDLDTLGTMKELREAGVGVVWDDDDDRLNLPRENPRHASYLGRNRRRLAFELRHAINLSHVVTTPSTALAARLRSFGAEDVRIVENFIPQEFVRVRPRRHPGIVVAMVAALEHQVDYQALQLKPVFERLLTARSSVRFLAVGLGLGLPQERCTHVPRVPLLQLAGTLAEADIGIAPLADIPFNRARSNVKLKEYGAAQLPWLASPVGPYAHLGEDQGGRLVRDDSWEQELLDLVDDGKARKRLAKRGHKWARTQTIDANVGQWLQVFEDAARRARQARPPSALPV